MVFLRQISHIEGDRRGFRDVAELELESESEVMQYAYAEHKRSLVH
jgi:hypothetical protein